MRWVFPVAVVVTGVGVLMLYVPIGKGAALVIPPQLPLALVAVGTIGIAVGVISAWRARSLGGVAGPRGGVADAIAVAGLMVALVAALAVGSVFIVVPVLVALPPPDPCGPSKFQPDTACFAAHPDYYYFDPVADNWSTPGSRLSQTVDAVAGPSALPLGLTGSLVSWLALAVGTGRRRIALLALTLSTLIVVVMVVLSFGLVLGGGD